MNPLRAIFAFLKRLFPSFNRAARRRFFHQQKTYRAQRLLTRYHLLWNKRPHSHGWWVRARRVSAVS